MGNLEASFKKSDLVKSFDVWGKTTVDTENLSFDLCTDAEVVENFAAVFPGIQVAIFANYLIVESVCLCDGT